MAAYDILYSTISDRDKEVILQFDCGNASLNRYLKRNAYFETVQRTASTCLVKISENNGRTWKIGAFFSLEFQHMHFGNDNIMYPVVYLKCLAVNFHLQNQGFGTRILKYILVNCRKIADFVGCRALALDAVSEHISFYLHAGFQFFSEKAGSNIENQYDTIKMVFDFRDDGLYDEFME